jgi:hypothetical protein
MAKDFQLHIPEPCQENWNVMTPSEKGRFCGSCQKQVIDFSTMSDRQIAQFFKKPTTGSVCGRFMQDQLDRDFSIPRKRIPWFKYFLQLVLPAALFSMKAKAQGSVIYRERSELSPVKCKVGEEKIDKKEPSLIEGRVVDQVGQPIPGASVVIKSSKLGCTTDAEGKFILKLPEVKEQVALMVTCVGYYQKEIIFTKNMLADRVNVSLTVVVVDVFFAGMVIRKVACVKPASDIKGRIVNEKGEPLQFASVTYKGSSKVLRADTNGSFSLKLKKKEKNVTLIASYVGYETTELKVGREKFWKELKIVLYPAVGTEGYDIAEPIVSKQEGSISTRVKDTISRLFKAYPNPIQRGTSLHIEWNQTETGNYFMQLISPGGQLVYSRKLWIDAEAKFLSLEVPSVAPGSYYLRMTNSSTGRSFTEKIVVL